MHILSIDQFNEKLTATSISLSDLKSVKIDKPKKPYVMERRLTNALSHLIDGYGYTFDQKGIVNGGSSKSIIDNPDVTIDIDGDTKTIYLENKSHKWSSTLSVLQRIFNYGYSIKFEDGDSLQIRSGGQSAKVYSGNYPRAVLALSDKNNFSEINFHKNEFDESTIPMLVGHCYIDVVSFVWCTYNNYYSFYNKDSILSHSKNPDLNMTSVNKVMSNRLKKAGWK